MQRFYASNEQYLMSASTSRSEPRCFPSEHVGEMMTLGQVDKTFHICRYSSRLDLWTNSTQKKDVAEAIEYRRSISMHSLLALQRVNLRKKSRFHRLSIHVGMRYVVQSSD